jgi:hypothetical protein
LLVATVLPSSAAVASGSPSCVCNGIQAAVTLRQLLRAEAPGHRSALPSDRTSGSPYLDR